MDNIERKRLQNVPDDANPGHRLERYIRKSMSNAKAHIVSGITWN